MEKFSTGPSFMKAIGTPVPESEKASPSFDEEASDDFDSASPQSAPEQEEQDVFTEKPLSRGADVMLGILSAHARAADRIKKGNSRRVDRPNKT